MRLFLYVMACLGCVAAPQVFLAGASGRGLHPSVYQEQAPAQPGLEQELGRLLRDRYAGTRQDYKEFNERTIGDTHVSVDERGSSRRVTRAMAVAHLSKFPGAVEPMPPEVKFAQTVEDITVEPHGAFAVVQYRREMPMVFNGDPLSKQFRCTEVFKRQSGDWQSVAYHETVIPGEIVPASIDPKIYDSFSPGTCTRSNEAETG